MHVCGDKGERARLIGLLFLLALQVGCCLSVCQLSLTSIVAVVVCL